ncbi:MAG: GntR family transcriptional regulator [Gammaproteobacteria bacterium]|nr:GntR family transcriptional regulator [Gammaproteobacteria bacterium]
MIEDFPLVARKQNETLQEWTYQQLRYAIMVGVFSPGVSVTMRGLAQMLGVSLMPVREALRRLVAEHALELLPNRRVSVPTMTAERFEELCATRINLECLAAERAILAVSRDDLEFMYLADAAMDKALKEGDVVESVIQNHHFHTRLYTAAPSQVLFPLIENLWLQFGPFMRGVLEQVGEDFNNGKYLVDRHQETLRAIERRDPPALRKAIEADIRDGIGATGMQGLQAAAKLAL